MTYMDMLRKLKLLENQTKPYCDDHSKTTTEN